MRYIAIFIKVELFMEEVFGTKANTHSAVFIIVF